MSVFVSSSHENLDPSEYQIMPRSQAFNRILATCNSYTLLRNKEIAINDFPQSPFSTFQYGVPLLKKCKPGSFQKIIELTTATQGCCHQRAWFLYRPEQGQTKKRTTHSGVLGGFNSVILISLLVASRRPFDRSIRPALNRVVLNVDTTVTMMSGTLLFAHQCLSLMLPYRYCPGSLLDSLRGVVGVRDVRDIRNCVGQPRHQRQIKRYVKGLRVKFRHKPNLREKSITDIEWQSAKNYEFEKDGQLITVSVRDTTKHPIVRRLM